MKNILKLTFLVAFTAMLTGCFKPDASSDETNLLEGYWEIIHLEEHDTWHYLRSDDTQSEDEHYDFSGEITCNDGNESYSILRFTPAYVTLIATDCPDDAELVGTPYPYSFSDGKLYGIYFQGDFCNFLTVEELDENTLVLSMTDVGTEMYDLEDLYGDDFNPSDLPDVYSIGEYSDYRSRMTYRKIQ